MVPNVTRMHPRRAARLAPEITRALCLLIAAASVVGLFFASGGGSGAAHADESSTVTVSWTGDGGALAKYQPARTDSTGARSVSFDEFKNITVTVDQTAQIADQAIQVKVTGFAGTRAKVDASGATWTSAQNYVQAMQCYGPDPLAADFNQTCEWGGRFVNNNGLGNTVYRDNVPRVALKDVLPGAQNAVDMPFVPLGSAPVTGRQVVDSSSPDPVYPLLDYFGPATSNELQSARMNPDGTGVFDFETQSSDEAPQLGCGSQGHTRCWLVLVPRGTVYGGHDSTCSDLTDNDYTPYAYGRADSIQGGSPVNTQCEYWANRIDIPLDFIPTGSVCAADDTQRRVIGSQLLIGAMASWQPQLCKDLRTTFSFDTNPDGVARSQLVEAQANLAFTSFPVVKTELDNDLDRAELGSTAIAYAPVALTSADIAFFAEGSDGRITDLRLSPRLMAKLLTQSYRFEVPTTSSDPSKNYAHLGVQNKKYAYLWQDPDFQALNPNAAQFASNPSIVLPGPSGADAIRQVWKWIQGDREAASWLAGTPDPWGMTVNPYYLPKGNPAAIVPSYIPNDAYTLVDCPATRTDWAGARCRAVGLSNVDGSPFQLSSARQDTFLKSDESLAPITLSTERYRFGSIQAAPYTDNFLIAARTAFRADPGAKTVWDPTAIDASGQVGDWTSGGAQIPGQRFMIAITDAPSAVKYALSSAALRLDDSSDFVLPTTDSISAAVGSALVPTEVDSVKQIDPAKTKAGQYPLSTVVYAAVNLSSSDKATRGDFSSMIAQVTTKGQKPGSQVGELPPGYVPLTQAMADQAQAAAAAIAAYVAPAANTGGSNGPAQDDYSGSFGSDGGATSGGAGGAGTGPSSTPAPSDAPGRTPGIQGGFSVGQVALGGSLATGLAGAIFSPLLFRGRRLLP